MDIQFQQVHSDCGRYTISHRSDFTGYAQIVEYEGYGPRVLINKFEVPMSFLITFMQQNNFSQTENFHELYAA
jgi:hypothetical protein